MNIIEMVFHNIYIVCLYGILRCLGRFFFNGVTLYWGDSYCFSRRLTMENNLFIDHLVSTVEMAEICHIGSIYGLKHYSLPFGVSYVENTTPVLEDTALALLSPILLSTHLHGLITYHPVDNENNQRKVLYVLEKEIGIEFSNKEKSDDTMAFVLRAGERTVIPSGFDVKVQAYAGSKFLDIPISLPQILRAPHMDENRFCTPTLLRTLQNPPLTNVDTRRAIVDVTPQVKVFSVADADGLRLGDHFHNYVNEWCFLISGSQLWTVELDGKRCEYTMSPGEIITVPKRVAHVVQPVPNTQFVGIIDRDFDPNDLYKFIF